MDAEDTPFLPDKVDITKNLTGGEDIFKGFKHPNGTLTDEFFVGPARLEHRGNYTCQVSSQPNVFWVPSRPVQYEVRVRVHGKLVYAAKFLSELKA